MTVCWHRKGIITEFKIVPETDVLILLAAHSHLLIPNTYMYRRTRGYLKLSPFGMPM